MSDQVTTPDEITGAVVRSFAGCPDERLRQILQALVRHLHAFAVDVKLTEAEWLAAIGFLTRTGQICTPTRQEFILLSDTLGVSMLVDVINHGKTAGATESTVLGPFYVPDSPWRANGDAIMDPSSGQPTLVHGQVTSVDGTPVPGAVLDVWQNAANMLYAAQDPGQPPDNGRGRFRADERGRFWFRTIRPVDYPISHDGPVGQMLAATRRHPWRPAHIHIIASAGGYEPVTTHIFDADSPYLDSDAVFGVKPSLVRRFEPHDAATEQPPPGMGERWYTVDCTIALQPAGTAAPDGKTAAPDGKTTMPGRREARP
jgi:protocatechuate 3,4-dioxygenase beta subunit